MAYKTDNTYDLFKRNTEYRNFGGILCCTCRMCVEKGSLPTVTFKNFRPRETLHPELPPNGVPNIISQVNPFYSAYIEFIQDLIPNGEFTYVLDFDNFAFENWDSPDTQSVLKYARNLTYYPFRECSGSPTSFKPNSRYYPQGWLSPEYGSLGTYDIPYSPPFEPDMAPYDCLINSGWPMGWGAWYGYDFLLGINLYQYSNSVVFNRCNTVYYYDESSTVPGLTNAMPFYYVHSEGVPVGPYSACTEEQLANNGSITVASPLPLNPIDNGNITCLINYMNSHEFSFGVKVDSDCENNVNAIMPPMPLIDYSGYSFQNVYPNSVELNRATYFTPTTEYPPGIIIKPINGFSVSGGGYVLTNMVIDLTQQFSNYNYDYIGILFKMNPTVYTPVGVYSCDDIEWGYRDSDPFPIQLDPPYYPAICGAKYVTAIINNFNTWHPTLEILNEYYFHLSQISRLSLKYTNGNVTSQGIYASFASISYIPFIVDYYYYNQYWSYFWYATQNTSIVNVPKSGITTTQTDSEGNTKVIIRDMLFTGPNYLSASCRQYDPILNYTAANYSKYLSIGFMCDVEINYRSTPICTINQVPDRIQRVEEFKVKMENYRPYQQPNLSARDGVVFLQEENPRDLTIYNSVNTPYDSPSTSFNAFNHVVYAPPDSNIDAEFIINKKGLLKQSVQSDEFVYKTFLTQVTPCSFKPKWDSENIGSIYGRYFAHNFEDERYRDSLFVSGDESMWETGNEITIPFLYSNDDLPVSWQPRYSSGSILRKYYCIFVKKISDNSFQSSGAIQIRLANSYDDAINEIHLPISNYSINNIINSRIKLEVKYKYFGEDITQFAAPYYSNFNISNYTINNPNLDNLEVAYTVSYNPPMTSSLNVANMTLYPMSMSDMLSGFMFYNKDVKIWNNYPKLSCNFNVNSIASGANPNTSILPNGISHFEFISLHPLKFIIRNALFTFDVGISYFNYVFNYTSLNKNTAAPWENKVFVDQIASGYFGFVCDITFEENIDEYHEHSLPQEFNAILTMDQYIQTSGVYNSKSPLKTINPEKCKHIGKVIDRKDCNCPKKWIRQCDLHETTDWKKCMGCPNFEPDED